MSESIIRGRLLGIDHGSKIIGVAVSEASGLLARPLTRITRSSREKDFAALNRLIQEQAVIGAVVGLPETPDGFAGVSQAETVLNWAARFAGHIPIPVYLWNETLSTFEAREMMGAGRERVDDVAAAIILQTFLDAIREGASIPDPVKPRRKGTDKMI